MREVVLLFITPLDSHLMAETILIIGKNGLIGSACQRLFETDASFNLLSPSRQELDLLDKKSVNRYLLTYRPDYVILAAGLVGGIGYNKNHPADLIYQNLMMALNLFEAANRSDVKRVIFFASSCMYPKECTQPMKESFLHTGPLEPTSTPYALSKLCGVEMAKAYNKQFQKERFIVLIPNTVYGPNAHFDPERAHVLPALIEKFEKAKRKNLPYVTLWGTGKPRREFIYSEDVAKAAYFFLKRFSLPIPINLGSGSDISIKELAVMIQQITGYPYKIKWDLTKKEGAKQKLLDHQRAAQLGWKPIVDLKQGISLTYKWYLSHQASLESASINPQRERISQ